ncbi:hypothetical protein GH983_18330 [Agrobacterium sp. MA01]|uniref:hypothetical protein n=1 Tax=Agrobacterium sp. MA01 TaxID=2664893 RepID=UPI00129B1709|nr:hypothetical protein [Agrobacterium sp. MA01]QGG92306.1 hypothetical protein GH983_18330 [Agrobacterium sp. MA01]
MEEQKTSSPETRRDRTGGIVRDKLDLLMHETRREAVPGHLIALAEELQSALDEKAALSKKPA